ncbi:MAG: ABC transporter ATP-binding protein [Candidatus Omnitrophota bacterium]|nr:MAG: ABC transporter ATP-binding protein [Candidatus Omnitrophota bacterium]
MTRKSLRPGRVLQVNNLCTGFNKTKVLSEINLTIDNGEVVALMGPSGCGKTTCIKSIADLISIWSGEVCLDIPSEKKFSVMFQWPLLQPWLNAKENIEMPCLIEHKKCDSEVLIEAVGLAGSEYKYPWELSGGMQRRVALARALVSQPGLLLLDEPFTGVDELTREKLYELLESIIYQSRIPCLFVTHNVYEAVYLADRIAVMTQVPATIADVLTVNIPRPRQPRIRNESKFINLVEKLRGLLSSNGNKI